MSRIAEGLGYVVVCSCSGQIVPLAFIDDLRPAAEDVIVRPIDGHDHVVWIPPNRRDLTREDFADLSRQPVGFTGELHTVRCPSCKVQAQMSRSSLAAIADHLAAQANTESLAQVDGPALGEGRPQLVGGWIYTPSPHPSKRYVVPLAVLCHRLGSQQW